MNEEVNQLAAEVRRALSGLTGRYPVTLRGECFVETGETCLVVRIGVPEG